MSNNSNTVVGLLAGTVIGAALGVLFAPDKGTKTRQRISDEALAAKDKISEKASEATDSLASAVSQKKKV
ncbi:YtxH domain-containing protein [Tenacibaculum aquimarinum]|uniref:YtxH domain-containing protein n=1 Tax=Tenacibaculum aquimarinum TaxID=2910675 RepID=UPI002868373D|nr:YtxH domain-containing protein [Tenacibaculum aquimarinum]